MIETFWECPKYRYVLALQEEMQEALQHNEKILYKRFMGCSNCIGTIIGNNDMCCMICIDTEKITTEEQKMELADEIRIGLQKRKAINERDSEKVERMEEI